MQEQHIFWRGYPGCEFLTFYCGSLDKILLLWQIRKKDRWRNRNLSYTKDKTCRTTLRATVVRMACFYYVFTTNAGINLPRFAPFCHFGPESWIVCIKKTESRKAAKHGGQRHFRKGKMRSSILFVCHGSIWLNGQKPSIYAGFRPPGQDFYQRFINIRKRAFRCDKQQNIS